MLPNDPFVENRLQNGKHKNQGQCDVLINIKRKDRTGIQKVNSFRMLVPGVKFLQNVSSDIKYHSMSFQYF